MDNFTVATINDSYMFRLQPSHHQTVYIRSITGNHTPLVDKELQMICVKGVGITCKSICDCYTWYTRSIYSIKDIVENETIVI